MVTAQQVPAPRQHERHHGATGIVTGRVLLADGQPAEQVSVRIKGSEHGTVTAADGSFSLKAPAGWQAIAVSCLGCVGQEAAV
ncbi:carboxypeptidase-like regulatory domain-containing protein, partial [Hymenobacter agri]